LEKANLTYAEITPVYLSPPDGAAAFARGSIDAWAIWDPYFAIGEAHGGRILVQATDIAKPTPFYIGNRDFAAREPQLLRYALDTLGAIPPLGRGQIGTSGESAGGGSRELISRFKTCAARTCSSFAIG